MASILTLFKTLDVPAGQGDPDTVDGSLILSRSFAFFVHRLSNK